MCFFCKPHFSDTTLIFDKAVEAIPGRVWETLLLDITFCTNKPPLTHNLGSSSSRVVLVLGVHKKGLKTL